MAFRRLDTSAHTKVEIIQHFIRAYPDASPDELRERYKDDGLISNSQFYEVRKQMRLAGEKVGGVPRGSTMPEPPWTPEEKPKKEKKATNGKSDKKYAAMKSEIEYLRWLLDGERKGFIDRWLKEQG